MTAEASETLFLDTFESGNVNWTYETIEPEFALQGWSIVTTDSYSPTHSAFCLDQPDVTDRALRKTTGLALTTGSPLFLEFRHRFNTESGFDGGVLEYSTDNGVKWFDILAGNGGTVPANVGRFVAGGYTGQISTGYNSPIAGRSAWTGANSAFQLTRVDISDMAGRTIKLRWRLSCDTTEPDPPDGYGWWVDDIRVLRAQSCEQGGYTAWRSAVSWTGSGDPQADDNTDGTVNYAAYFFGIPPTGAVPPSALSRLPSIRPEGTNWVYGFELNTDAVMAATFSVQTRTNLLDGRWQPVLPSPDPDASGRVAVPLAPPDARHLYYRLQFEE